MSTFPPPRAPTQWKTLVAWFDCAFAGLGLDRSDARIETLAVDVVTAMSGPLRRFHTLDHVFHFEPADPLETLAVLYHDVVYWSVDGGWPPCYAHLLDPVAVSGLPGTPLATACGIPFYADILALFGLAPGAALGKTGVNELASALVAAAVLGSDLGRDRTLAVAACIEGTIPFRGGQARLALRDRLASLGFAMPAIDGLLVRSVHLANQDVSDFYHEDPGSFLSGTWNLLPELNPALRLGSVFPIGSYRAALVGMDSFFAFLKPGLLFDSWDAEPGPTRLAELHRLATVNLSIARGYIEAKLLSIALLEAFARATGPDVPLAVFMGGAQDPAANRLEATLPAPPEPPASLAADPVFHLLDQGRTRDASFDLTNSPLAAWIYRLLDADERTSLAARARQMFRGELEPHAFLAACPAPVIRPLAQSLAAFVPTRSQAILALGL
jgi:hypothetical protein